MPVAPIQTPNAPKAIGPYSQGVRVGELVFTSGQVPIDPTTGEMVGGDIRAQTTRVMENLKAVLVAGGSSLDRVVKTTIFLADLADFGAVNEVYGSYFSGAPPARSTVQVSRLPKDARIEIEMIGTI